MVSNLCFLAFRLYRGNKSVVTAENPICTIFTICTICTIVLKYYIFCNKDLGIYSIFEVFGKRLLKKNIKKTGVFI